MNLLIVSSYHHPAQVYGGPVQAIRHPGVHFPGFEQADELPNYYGLASVFIILLHISSSGAWSSTKPWPLVFLFWLVRFVVAHRI